MSREAGKKRGRPRKLNLYEKNNGWYTGQLLHGKTFQIDEADYEKVRLYTWRCDRKGYVYTIITKNRVRRRIYLHRLLMHVASVVDWKAMQIDHIDGNPLNNRRDNLRYASAAENQINKKKPRIDSTTRVTGVTYDKSKGKYVASIGYGRHREYLGAFNSLEEAMKIRQEAEELLYGEFSNREAREDH